MKKTIFLVFSCMVMLYSPVIKADMLQSVSNLAHANQKARGELSERLKKENEEILKRVEALEEETKLYNEDKNRESFGGGCGCCDQDDASDNLKDETILRLARLEQEMIKLKQSHSEQTQEHGGDL